MGNIINQSISGNCCCIYPDIIPVTINSIPSFCTGCITGGWGDASPPGVQSSVITGLFNSSDQPLVLPIHFTVEKTTNCTWRRVGTPAIPEPIGIRAHTVLYNGENCIDGTQAGSAKPTLSCRLQISQQIGILSLEGGFFGGFPWLFAYSSGIIPLCTGTTILTQSHTCHEIIPSLNGYIVGTNWGITIF